METKLYEHEAWARLVDERQASLLERSTAAWNREWLEDLHSFNIVVRDADLCAVHVSDLRTVNLADFYGNLFKGDPSNLPRLLREYASHDAAAALLLAENCGIDLPEKAPEVIFLNCDQEPFLALMRQQAANEESRRELWAVLLAEAGLRSSVVAHWLREKESEDWIEELVDRVPRRQRWFGLLRYGVWKRNHYLELLTVGARSRDLDPGKFVLLDMLRSISPIGRSVFQLSYGGGPILLSIGILSFMLIPLASGGSELGLIGSIVQNPENMITFTAFYVAAFIYMRIERSVRSDYTVIINTQPDWLLAVRRPGRRLWGKGGLAKAADRMVSARNTVAA